MYCVHATYIYFKVHFHRKLPHQSKPIHLLQIAEIGTRNPFLIRTAPQRVISRPCRRYTPPLAM